MQQLEVPDNITMLAASNTNGNLAIVASLAATASVTNYIMGFDVTGLGATAAVGATVTVTGLTTNLSFAYTVVAGATNACTPLSIRFPQALPASAANTAIAVNVPTFGAGNTIAAVNVYGFRK